MTTWRDELLGAIKGKAERKLEEDARKQKRLDEALTVAAQALEKAAEGLRFTDEQLRVKKQPCKLSEDEHGFTLAIHEIRLAVALRRTDAVLKVTLGEGRPREFDFSNDRHLSARDVEEYVGRRAVELVRAAQKTNPW